MYINVILEGSDLLAPVTQVPEQQPLPDKAQEGGFLAAWERLRFGYFWGGEGETILRINADHLSTICRNPAVQHPKDLVAPFQASAEVLWQQADQQPQSTTATVRTTAIRMQPCFSSAPMLQALVRDIYCPAVSKQGMKAETSQMHPASHPHAGSMRLDMNVQSFTAALIDDRCGGHIEALTISIQDVDMKFQRVASLLGPLPETTGSISLALEVLFLNSAVDAQEPIIESWALSLTYHHMMSLRCVSLTSEQRLNVIATPAAFRSIGDLRCFLLLFTTSHAAVPDHPPAITTRRTMHWLSQSSASMPTSYRLVNRSGLRLAYWARSSTGNSTVYALNAWEETPLLVEPVQRNIVLAETQQQVLARTLCMQLDGSYGANCDIMVDKVGKYAYSISNPAHEAVTPVILDVALESRVKVLTVHSPFRLENRTSVPLSFVVHTSGHASGHGTTLSRAPHSGPLAPGSQCYLAVNSVWGGILYIQASNGYKVAKRDRILLEAGKLKDAQGIYTCPASPEGSKPDFHCCMEVQEAEVLHQGKLLSGSFMEFMPEFTLSFQPPLTILNCLPCEIMVNLTDTNSRPQQFSIDVGASIKVYSYDLSRKIHLAMQLQDYKSRHRVTIHYPPALGLDDSVRQSVIADLPGLRLAKDIILQKDPSAHSTPITSALAGSRLTLRIHNKLNAASMAREVVVFCPYWIVNKTNTTLRIRDVSPCSSVTSTASPMADDGTAKPVLFSSQRGAMRLCMHAPMWSRSINLESVGMHGSIYVMLPAQMTIGEKSVSGLRLLETLEIVGSVSRKPKQPDSAPAEADSEAPVQIDKGQKHRHSHSDPGHILARFNCVAAQSEGPGDPSRRKRYDLAIDASFGPDIFHRTKVITITHKYILINTSDRTLQCGQRGTSTIWQLLPETRAPFHWPDAGQPLELCLRPGTGWRWSGAFKIGIAGAFGVRTSNMATKEHHILPVSISMQGASCIVSLGSLHIEPPPYRIVNRCEALSLKFQQKDLDTAAWDEVQTGQQMDYAFDEPLLPHKIRVVLSDNGFLDQSVHEYPLDIIKAHPVIKMKGSKRTNVVTKMAGTMGRALATPLHLATGKASLMKPQAVDQPDVEMRYIYVGVHADGPTRVLCFSDRKDQYTQGTNEDNMAILGAKLARLEARLKDVNKQLHEVEGRSPGDPSMLVSKGTGRYQSLQHAHRLSLAKESGGLRSQSLPESVRSPQQSTGAPLENLMRAGSSIPPVTGSKKADGPQEQTILRRLSAIGEADSESGETEDMLAGIKGDVHQAVADPAKGSGLHQDMPASASQDDQTVMAASATGAAADAHAPGEEILPAIPCESASVATAIPESESISGDTVIVPQTERTSSDVLPGSSTVEQQDMEELLAPEGAANRLSRQGSGLSRMLSLHRASSLPHSNRSSPATSPKSPKPVFLPSTHAEAPHQASPQGRLSSALRRALVVLGGGGREERRARFAEDKDVAQPAEKESILGGELLVRVENGQGIYNVPTGAHGSSPQGDTESSAEASTGPAGFQENLRAYFSPKRGGTYALLQCEGQVLRTPLALGRYNPVWRHEVSFKSVQISSDLKVSLYRRTHLRQDIFLGDVSIPLSEVDDTGNSAQTSELRRYTLARRSVKDKVRGEINLACCWRVTPQDVLTLRVRNLAAEVSQREEMLAVLAERTGQEAAESSNPELPASSNLKVQWPASLLPAQLKMARTSRGRLGVKIIEARGLSLPTDHMPSIFGPNLYTMAMVTGDFSSTSARTQMHQGDHAPRWNQEVVFPDVGLAYRLTLTVLIHRRLGAGSPVGQASVPLDTFVHGRPQYMWLPLVRSARKLHPTGSFPAGSLRVRIQWAAEDLLELEPPPGESVIPNFSLELALHKGIEVSIVEAGRSSLPREVAHVLLDRVEADFQQSHTGTAGRLAIHDVQIDNQLLTSTHPVVLAHAPSMVHQKDGGDHPALHNRPPFLEASWETTQHNPSILYFKNAYLALQEMDLLVEEEFLDVMVSLARHLPFEDLWQAQIPAEAQSLLQDQSRRVLQDLLSASSTRRLGPGLRSARKWYFETLLVQEVRCNLTLIPRAGVRDEAAVLGRLKMVATLGIQFLDINRLPLRINALPLRHAFVSPQSLYNIVTRHLIFQALQQMHKVLGQVDVLGTPIVLGSSLLSGFSSLIIKPTRAHSPEEFLDNVFSGTFTLLRNAAFGLMNAFGQVAGGAGKAFAFLTTDQEYINRFRTRPRTYRQNVLHGLQSAGVGFYEGAIGILKEPVVRWQDNGFLGVSHGLYIGTSGLIFKPLSGTLDMISKVLCGASGTIKAWGDEATRSPPKSRVRNPRQLSALSGNMRNLRQQRMMLARLEKGRYAGDSVLDYLQNKDNKALILTDRRLIYIDLKRQSVRWAFSLVHLFSVSTSGLAVLLQHELTVPCGFFKKDKKMLLHMPARKIVRCRTRELHQSLLVKLGSCLLEKRESLEPHQAAHFIARDVAVHMDDLHITNKPPPHPIAHDSSQASRRPSALKRLSTFLIPSKAAVSEAPRSEGASAGGQGSPTANLRPADCKASAAAENSDVRQKAASLDAAPSLGAATVAEAAARMANTSAHCPSGHCSGRSDGIPCNPSQAAHEEREEVGRLRDVHGGGAGMSAGQGGHITFRNGVLEAVHLMVEQSRGVSAARLRESMSGIAQLCHIGLLGTEGEGTAAGAKLAAIKALTHTLEAANLETAEIRGRIVTALLMLCGQEQHA